MFFFAAGEFSGVACCGVVMCSFFLFAADQSFLFLIAGIRMLMGLTFFLTTD